MSISLKNKQALTLLVVTFLLKAHDIFAFTTSYNFNVHNLKVHQQTSNILKLNFKPNKDEVWKTPTSSPSSVVQNKRKTPSITRSTLGRTITGTSLHSVLNPVVFSAALGATAKLLSSIGIGALTTPVGPKQFGQILDGSAVSALSKLTYWLFQPCFLLCGVASTLSKAAASSSTATTGSAAAANVGLPTNALLLLPIAAMIQIGLGGITAKIITTKRFGMRPLLGIDTDDDAGASDIQMCTTFANSGPLPLIISDALFQGNILSDVTACISFYLLIWSPLFWTAGKNILGLTQNSNSEKETIVALIGKQIKAFLSPPVLGSIMGVIIGSTPFLRNTLMKQGGALFPLFGSLRTFGVAYLPSAILVLAGSLVKKQDINGSNDTVTATKSLSPRTVISILASRFLLSPVLALTTVKLMTFFGLMPVDNARTLAVVTFTLLMEGCMPPAQNSVIMLQLANEKERASKMARLLTVSYALSVIPVTLLLSGCLSISGVLNFL